MSHTNESSNICTWSCESDESARKENFGHNTVPPYVHHLCIAWPCSMYLISYPLLSHLLPCPESSAPPHPTNPTTTSSSPLAYTLGSPTSSMADATSACHLKACQIMSCSSHADPYKLGLGLDLLPYIGLCLLYIELTTPLSSPLSIRMIPF